MKTLPAALPPARPSKLADSGGITSNMSGSARHWNQPKWTGRGCRRLGMERAWEEVCGRRGGARVDVVHALVGD
jgi:hypothetical protein